MRKTTVRYINPQEWFVLDPDTNYLYRKVLRTKDKENHCIYLTRNSSAFMGIVVLRDDDPCIRVMGDIMVRFTHIQDD